MYQSLADIMGFETIPAICTGDLKKDNFRNARLYRELLDKDYLSRIPKRWKE